MLTKYILHIGDDDYELQTEDLKNWAEIRCSYKRASYDGVVRSFTSQFEFVNHAKDLLFECYLADRFNAKASISVHTINDNWEYDKVFECPLDFSTIEVEAHTLKLNSVDKNLAAIIKANKSTKYEFEIGADIMSEGYMYFDRLPIKEALTYEISQGESQPNDGSLIVPPSENARTFCGLLNDDEIFIGRAVTFNQNQNTDEGSYILKALRSVAVDVEMRFEFDRCYEAPAQYPNPLMGGLAVLRADGTSEYIGGNEGIVIFVDTQYSFKGDFATEEALKTKYPQSVIINDTGIKHGWWANVNGEVWEVVYNGDITRSGWENTHKSEHVYRRQSFKFSSSVTLAEGDKIAFVTFGDGAHVYSSCIQLGWQVKGDSCQVPVIAPWRLVDLMVTKMCDGSDVIHDIEISDHDARLAHTFLLAAESIRDIPNAKIYSSFGEFADWMSAVFGYIYTIDENNVVHFLHRSEVMNPEANVRKIAMAKDFKLTIDNNNIYSTVTAGYEKKDYENINGRDEFNFNNTYSTSCRATDKTLSLISKYRADSYGIEFAAQKRGADSTDNKSDKDIFFVLTTAQADGTLVPDRTVTVENAVSNEVFNGAFSPMACIRANAGYIGLQADSLTLKFASSTANSSIVVGDTAMSADLTLVTPLATCSILEFTTDEVDDIADPGELIEVDDDGMTYRGFLQEVDVKYARTEAAKYKIIVKDIEP